MFLKHIRDLPAPHSNVIDHSFYSSLVTAAAKDNKSIDCFNINAVLKDGSFSNFVEKFKEIGTSFLNYHDPFEEKDARFYDRHHFFMLNHGAAIGDAYIVIVDNDDEYDVSLYSIDKKLFDKASEFLLEHFKEVEEKEEENKHLNMVVSTSYGFQIKNVGIGGSTLERGNYSPKILQHYDAVVKEFSKDNPFGRLVIMHGLPGCGKTHMIRGLMNELPNSEFVLIPSNMIKSLVNPEFIPALVDFSRGDTHVVLILEDADTCLVDREKGTLEALSNLLNLSDGIIGTTLNLRIIATANTDKGDMDEAVLREGRLHSQFELGKLSSEQGKDIYKRITGKEYDENTLGQMPEVTLGEAYAATKGKKRW